MDEETRKALSDELAAVCAKYDVIISSEASAADDTNLECNLVFSRVTRRVGRWPVEKDLFTCDVIGRSGIS
jgi:hypothetical protein